MTNNLSKPETGTSNHPSGALSKQTINIDQVQVGLFIELDLSWLEHPFFFRSFLIKDAKQLQALKKLGLKEITYNPRKSTTEPLPAGSKKAATTSTLSTAELDEMWKEKNLRIDRMKERRQRVQQCSQKFEQSVAFMKKALRKIRAYPDKSVGAAEQIIDGMVRSLFDDPDAALHLVNIKKSGIGEHAHFVNVAVLSLMLGKALGLDKEEMRLLGIGAIFHDIGTLMIPEKVLRKKGPLTQAEKKFYRMHPEYGIKIGQEVGVLPPEVLAIIGQHHEAMDGQGYPRGLKGGQIYKLAKIVAIADTYDVYCNSSDQSKSLSPYEAISYMFAKEKQKYDEEMLNTFISSLGVYPPGTVVELSNDKIGLVVTINSGELLKPNILLYSDSIPKEEAAVIDLREEEDIKINQSIRPSTLPREIHNYLELGASVNHYFDSSSG